MEIKLRTERHVTATARTAKSQRFLPHALSAKSVLLPLSGVTEEEPESAFLSRLR
jgi:hypothetical protein